MEKSKRIYHNGAPILGAGFIAGMVAAVVFLFASTFTEFSIWTLFYIFMVLSLFASAGLFIAGIINWRIANAYTTREQKLVSEELETNK